MIKEELIGAIRSIKSNNKLTYTDLENLSGLTRSQLIAILTKKGEKVSVERMEVALKKLGFGVELTFYELMEDL